MTDKSQDGNPRQRRTLSLNRTVESGQVRQSFSHGRSKSVVVEKKRRRVVVSNGNEASVEDAPSAKTPAPEAAPPPRRAAKRAPEVKQTDAGLSNQEQEERAAAIARARTSDGKSAKATPGRVGQKVARAAEPKTSKDKKDKSARAPSTKPQGTAAKPAPAVAREPKREQERRDDKRVPDKRRERPRRAGKLTLKDAFIDEERMRSLASIRRMRERDRRQKQDAPSAKISRQIIVPETITVQDLAARMAVRAADVHTVLKEQGASVEADGVLDADTAQLIAEELGHTVRRIAESDIIEGLGGGEDADADKTPRPPVVAVMGHVDHGKTSLLDALRQSQVAKGEAGGITQHIGAYQITTDGKAVTFLDTPGHAAFTAMRARGAQCTDIVVLVVAADDSVMPQTKEAIAHARAAEVPMIVAINKIDAPGADVEKVKSGLIQEGVLLEGAGGEVQYVEVSATQKKNLDKLLAAILLQAELLELKANAKRAAEGVVLESRLDKGRGALMTVLVQRGSLRRGDIFVVGETAGRVRAISDANGRKLKEAPPGAPVEVLGAARAPAAGDMLHVVDNEAKAREIAAYRGRKEKTPEDKAAEPLNLMQILEHQKEEDEKEQLGVILKADAQGTLEALAQTARALGEDNARIEVLHEAVGEISENDVLLAKASNAVVLGFHVRANAQARKLAEQDKVALLFHTVIYEAADELKQLLEGRLRPQAHEHALGKAEVLELFTLSGKRKIAGCRVLEGLVRKGASVRVRRGEEVLGEAEIETLKHFKDEAREVKSGQECGVGLTDFAQVSKGDTIECFQREQVARRLA